MATYEEEQLDRDMGIVNMMCVMHTAGAKYFEDWMQREIRGLIPRIGALVAMDAALTDELKQAVDLVNRINEQDMRQAFPRLYSSINEVERGMAGEDPVQCHRDLYATFGEVQNLAAQLLAIRERVDDLWRQAKRD